MVLILYYRWSNGLLQGSYIALGAVGVYPNHSIYDHPARGIYWDRLGHKQVKMSADKLETMSLLLFPDRHDEADG